MEFNIKIGDPAKQRTPCLVAAVFENKILSSTAEQLDQASAGHLSKIIRKGDLEGKLGQMLLLHNVPNVLCDRILLIGCGQLAKFNARAYKTAIQAVITALNNLGAVEAICSLTECEVKERDLTWKIQQGVIAAANACYSFTNFKSTQEQAPPKLKRFIFSAVNRKELTRAEAALQAGSAIAKGVKFTKDLANTPANICNPSYLAKQAQKLSKTYKHISCAVLEQKDMQALGMGALLAVAQGSVQPPKLITLEYVGGSKREAPIVLVGKGITFDTGGSSLKTPAAMIGMKYDMSGAATVLGTMLFAAEMQLPIHLVGVIASAENMPSGTASRPDDIVKSLAGIYIEILNTDAEGRLVLCDALAYCERFKPAAVIDIATLTGACVIALGRHNSGLYSNNTELLKELELAGKISTDNCWPMPISEEYQEQLNSIFADVANIGGAEAGSVTAACFLARFAEKFPWAHLDIAGTATTSDDKSKMATGRPVPLLAQYLLNKVANG